MSEILAREVPMSDILIRTPQPGETQALRDIWSLVFGNTGLSSFFELLYDERLCMVADINGSPAAVGYLVPTGDLLLNNTQVPCAMIYSVATLPGHRGKGLGTAVVRKLTDLARELDFPAIVLCPSDSDLFEYYSKHTELKEYFYAREQILSYEQVFKHRLSGNRMALLKEVPADEYIRLRENLLIGVPHIRQEQNIFDYQISLCKELGGGLFQLNDSCAVAEAAPDGTVLIKELLTFGIDKSGTNYSGINYSGINDSGATDFDLIAAIASRFPAHSYIVRSPAQKEKGSRFGMLGFDADTGNNADTVEVADRSITEPWYGMGLE